MRLKTLAVAAALACLGAPQANAQAPIPSDAFITAQQAYEAAYLTRANALEESDMAETMRGLLDAAAEAAEETYGRDWSIVAAETQRRMALLRPFDLAPYAAQTAQRPWAEIDAFSKQSFAEQTSSSARLVVMQWYDPRAVAYQMFNVAVTANSDPDEVQRNILISTYAPLQAYSAMYDGRAAIVATLGPFVLVIPYQMTQEGLISPDPEQIIYYRRG